MYPRSPLRQVLPEVVARKSKELAQTSKDARLRQAYVGASACGAIAQVVSMIILIIVIGLLIWIGVSLNSIRWGHATPEMLELRQRKRTSNKIGLLIGVPLLIILWALGLFPTT